MTRSRNLLAFSAGLALVCTVGAQPVEYEVLAASGQQAIGQPVGVTYRNFDLPFLDELGRVTYDAYLNGSTISGGVVYRTGEAEPQILFQGGVTPTGFGANAELGPIGSLGYGNESGDLAFKANILYLDSNPAPSLYGTWTYSDDFGVRAVSFGGLHAPGTNAIMCSGVAYWYRYLLSNAGHVAIFNHLCGSNANNEVGMWVSDENGQNLMLAVLSGDAATSIPGATFKFLDELVSVSSQGTLVFRARIQGSGVTSDNDRVFYAWNAQTGLTLLARNGDPVPGFPQTVTFKLIKGARVNDLGHTMIWGTIQGPGITDDSDQIILCDRDGNGLEHAYRKGIQAPQLTPGVKIADISRVYFNNKSQIAFFSDVEGPLGIGEDGEYFWSESGPPGLTPVAHTGQPMPGFDEPHILVDFQFYDLGYTGPEPEFTDSGRLSFVAQVGPSEYAPLYSFERYYLSDSVGELRDILPPGTQIDVSNVPGSPDIRTVERAKFRLLGSSNDADQVAAVAYFEDDTSAAVLVSYADSCLADVNGDGLVTPADFTAWVGAFNLQAPECDQNGDDQCTPADFTAWISNYINGC